jgi:hypothetical protein
MPPQQSPDSFATGISSHSEPVQQGPIWFDPDTGKYWTKHGDAYVETVAPPKPGAVKRFLTQSVGMPENVDTSLKGNIADLEQMNQHPLKALGQGAKQFIGGLDPTASWRETKGVAAQRYAQPGIANKAAGVAEGLVGAVPYVGAPTVRSMEQSAKGDYAGSAGSLLNSAWSMLALKAAPKVGEMAATTGLRPMMRRFQGVGEPARRSALQNVNEQASNVIGENATLERQQTGRGLMDEMASHGADQIGDLAETASKDVRKEFNKKWADMHASIGPSTPIDWSKVEAAIRDTHEGLNNAGLQQEFRTALHKAGVPSSYMDTLRTPLDPAAITPMSGVLGDVPYAKAQGIYTRLGEAAAKVSGPDAGQNYRALVSIQKPLGEAMGAAHDAAGSGPAYRQLKSDYTDFMESFNDPGAPVRQLIDSDTPEGRMRVLQKYNLNDKVAGILDKYSSPALASSIRSLVRTMNDLPSAPGGQPKPVPEWPGNVEWREQQLQNKLRQQSQSSSLAEMVPGQFRTRGALGRQLGISLLDKPAYRDWLSGRGEQLRPFTGPVPPTGGGGAPSAASPPTAAPPPSAPPAPPAAGPPAPGPTSVPPWAIGPLLKAMRENAQRQEFENLVKRLGGQGKVGPL